MKVKNLDVELINSLECTNFYFDDNNVACFQFENEEIKQDKYSPFFQGFFIQSEDENIGGIVIVARWHLEDNEIYLDASRIDFENHCCEDLCMIHFEGSMLNALKKKMLKELSEYLQNANCE